MSHPFRALLESDCAADPIEQLERWVAEADPSGGRELAWTLATATSDGRPSARVVLLRGIGAGGLVFYTSYASRKGVELDANPRAAGVIHWPDQDRQVRAEGPVERLSDAESDAYFARRALGHRISAWASPQSRVVRDRRELEQRVEQVIERHRRTGAAIRRPPEWGGYRLIPEVVEFWQGRMHRLHDRLQYRPDGHGGWRIERLAP